MSRSAGVPGHFPRSPSSGMCRGQREGGTLSVSPQLMTTRRGLYGRRMPRPDWMEWHRDYDDPGSLLSRRGELVQRHLRAELDRAPAGYVRLISLLRSGPGSGRRASARRRSTPATTASCRWEPTGWRASPPRWRRASGCSPYRSELSKSHNRRDRPARRRRARPWRGRRRPDRGAHARLLARCPFGA
jgi:hypothetical protein